MPAVTVRAAAAEAGCSVGLMRHYYDTKSLMLACTYELVIDAQLRAIRSLLFARRNRVMSPIPPPALTPADGARLLSSYLGLEGLQFLVGVQLSFLAMGQHDAPVGAAVASHHGGLQEICAVVLEESGVPADVVAEESEGLWVLLVGLTAIVPGLAVAAEEDAAEEDAAEEDAAEEDDGPTVARHRLLSDQQVEGVLRRHLAAVVARHTPSLAHEVNDR